MRWWTSDGCILLKQREGAGTVRAATNRATTRCYICIWCDISLPMLPICSLPSKENGCRPALLTVDLCSGSISDQICANRYEGWTELRAGRRRHAAFFSPLQTTGLAGGNTTSGLCYRPPAVLRRPILTPQSSGVSELQGPVSNLSCVCVCVCFQIIVNRNINRVSIDAPAELLEHFRHSRFSDSEWYGTKLQC